MQQNQSMAVGLNKFVKYFSEKQMKTVRSIIKSGNVVQENNALKVIF